MTTSLSNSSAISLQDDNNFMQGKSHEDSHLPAKGRVSGSGTFPLRTTFTNQPISHIYLTAIPFLAE
jgi:hypothetical protein